MKFSIRGSLIAFVFVALSFAGIVQVHRVIGPAYPRAKLRLIQVGMTQNQVCEILGEPTEKSEDQWIYTTPGNAGWVEVAFDTNECVAFVNDESVFPPRH